MSELERKYEERRRRQEEISRSNALVDYNRQKRMRKIYQCYNLELITQILDLV